MINLRVSKMSTENIDQLTKDLLDEKGFKLYKHHTSGLESYYKDSSTNSKYDGFIYCKDAVTGFGVYKVCAKTFHKNNKRVK